MQLIYNQYFKSFLLLFFHSSSLNKTEGGVAINSSASRSNPVTKDSFRLPIYKEDMGGEGSMLSAIKTLKANRALLKKRKHRDKKDFITSERTLLNLKESTPKDLARIKRMMLREKRKDLLISIITILILGSSGLLLYLFLF